MGYLLQKYPLTPLGRTVLTLATITYGTLAFMAITTLLISGRIVPTSLTGMTSFTTMMLLLIGPVGLAFTLLIWARGERLPNPLTTASLKGTPEPKGDRIFPPIRTWFEGEQRPFITLVPLGVVTALNTAIMVGNAWFTSLSQLL